MAKRLINEAKEAVTEAIEGWVQGSSHLARLDGFPGIKVVIRREWDATSTTNVALVSGGGAGHAPAHIGYVGEGMLTAAVSGDVFASPSTEAVLAAIRAVGRPNGPGVLLIVKNYTGDRLNFGIAAEIAKGDGIPVEMVVVADDAALPKSKGITGRRGVAGTVLVHKICGAAAQSGMSLSDVTALAQSITQNLNTLGVSLSTCTVPGQPKNVRLTEQEMEVGLGIHGEPGMIKQTVKPVDSIVTQMFETLLSTDPSRDYLSLAKGDRVVLLVNNLGATTPLELAITTRAALAELVNRGIEVSKTLQGSYMTALDMVGISITLLKVNNDSELKYLSEKTQAAGWPNSPDLATQAPKVLPVPVGKETSAATTRPASLTPLGIAIEKAISLAMTELIKAEPELTAMDKKVGDGDIGQTFEQGAKRVLQDMKESYELNSMTGTVTGLSLSVSQSMGGTSGVLYRILLTAMIASLKAAADDSSPAAIAQALAAGVAAVQKYGGASIGFRTMLDALIPASDALSAAFAESKSAVEALAAAAKAARDGAEATKTMEALAGRSNYIPKETLNATPDPGAVIVAIIAESVLATLR